MMVQCSQRLQQWLDSVFTASEGKKEYTTLVDSSTREAFGRVAHTELTAIDTLVQTAEQQQKAFEKEWTGAQRRDALLKWASLIEEHKEDLVYLEAKQGGKPVNEGRIDVDEVVACFRYFAGISYCVEGHLTS